MSDISNDELRRKVKEHHLLKMLEAYGVDCDDEYYDDPSDEYVDSIVSIFSQATELAVLDARIEELNHIDYGCEDTDENEGMLELIMSKATSTMDGCSLKDRLSKLEALKKQALETQS